MKLKFENPLVNDALHVRILGAWMGGMMSAIFVKMQGTYLSITMITFLTVLIKVTGLVQPFIKKMNIPISTCIKFVVWLNVVWFILIVSYVCGYLPPRLFIILNCIHWPIKHVWYTAVNFNLNYKIADLVNFEDYQITRHTTRNISAIISLSISATLCDTFDPKVTLAVGSMLVLGELYLFMKLLRGVVASSFFFK